MNDRTVAQLKEWLAQFADTDTVSIPLSDDRLIVECGVHHLLGEFMVFGEPHEDKVHARP